MNPLTVITAPNGGDVMAGELSPVVPSLQLPFAVIPLVQVSADPKLMGPFATRGPWKFIAVLIVAAIVLLNLTLIWSLL